MKHFLVPGLLLIILIPVNLKGQNNFEFSYDYAGNRINRSAIVLKKGSSDSKGENRTQEVRPVEDKTLSGNIVRIYPNPTKGTLNIGINPDDEIVPGLVIMVFDFNGRKLVERKVVSTNTEIDLGIYPDGIYFLVLKNPLSVSRWKVIKEQ